MSLEKDLVFDLRSKGNSEEDVLQIVKYMGDPNASQIDPVNLDLERVEREMRRYSIQEDYKNPANNKKSIKKGVRERIAKLVGGITEEITKRYESVLSVRSEIRRKIKNDDIREEVYLSCRECHHDLLKGVYLKIDYLKKLKSSVVKQQKKLPFVYFCDNCGSVFKYLGLLHDPESYELME